MEPRVTPSTVSWASFDQSMAASGKDGCGPREGAAPARASAAFRYFWTTCGLPCWIWKITNLAPTTSPCLVKAIGCPRIDEARCAFSRSAYTSARVAVPSAHAAATAWIIICAETYDGGPYVVSGP